MDILNQAPVTLCQSKVTLAAGTTSTISNTGTTTFAINSVPYTKTAMTNVATPTTDWATGAAFIPIPIPGTTFNLPPGVPSSTNGYVCGFLVGLDNGGNLRAIQGPIMAIDASGNPINGVTLPSGIGPGGPANTNANNFCPIGYVAVKLGSTAVATWTFGSNNWAGVTGVTTSFGDLIALPGRPLTGLTFA